MTAEAETKMQPGRVIKMQCGRTLLDGSAVHQRIAD
jgi:hypothetical protein